MKILSVDIETRPNLAHVWRLWDENVGLDQLLEPVEMICFAAKWQHETKTRFKSTHKDGRQAMVEAAWALLDEADVVVHYNGRTFDVPHLNREFITAGLNPPSPFKQLDLYWAVKKNFSFPSYKLAYVGPALGLGEKVDHEGHKLWVSCMAGDAAAWKRMRAYNEQDVLLVERLYDRLLPWISNHPSYGAMTGDDVCPNCGSDDLARDGFAYTKVGKFQQYRCRRCSKYSRSTKRVEGTKVTEVVR